MTFSDAVRTCLREKYVTFSGRAPRSEYWWFYLFNVLINIAIYVLGFFFVGAAIFTGDPSQAGGIGGAGAIIFSIITIIVGLGLILPNIAVLVRRFHDRNISGWYILGGIIVGFLSLVLLGSIGGLVFLALCIAAFVITVLKGTDGPNNFGPDPLRASDADVFN